LKQGNLFFRIATFLKEKRPPAFMLENVKNIALYATKDSNLLKNMA